MTSNSGAILTPQEYASQTGLEALLSKSVNDCYLTQSTCPAATLSALLQATYSVDLISDISVSECLDGDSGGPTAEVHVSLACGVEASTTISHSNSSIPFHPASAVNRTVALVPAEILAKEGPGSLKYALQPPVVAVAAQGTATVSSTSPSKGGKQGGGSGAEAARLLQDRQVALVGDFATAGSASALIYASKFALTGPLQYFVESVRPRLVATLRAAQQQALDDAVRLPDPTYASLLGQVSSSISLCCAKAAAKSLNKPLYSHIAQLYQSLDGGVVDRRVVTAKGVQAGGGIGGVRHGSHSIPSLAISVFTNADPRSPAKVRAVREVLLMVNLQDNSPSSSLHIDGSLLADAAAARVAGGVISAAAPGGNGGGSGSLLCPLASGVSDGASILKTMYPTSQPSEGGSSSPHRPSAISPSLKRPTVGGRTSIGDGSVAGRPPGTSSSSVAAAPSTATGVPGAIPTVSVGEFSDFSDPNVPRSGLLTFRTVSAANTIVHVAMAKLATVAGAALGVSPSVAESALMPISTDGAVKAPFFDSIAAAVQCIEEAIKEVTGNPAYFDMPAASTVPSADGIHAANNGLDLSSTPAAATGKKGASAAASGGAVQDGTTAGPRSGRTGFGLGGGSLSDVAAAIALKASFSPPPLFTVGLVVDGTLCLRQTLPPAVADGGPTPSAVPSPSSTTPSKYCVLQGEPDVSGKQLADMLAQLACVDKPNVLTYLEDTHSFADIDGMQRLMGKAYGARMVRRPATAADGSYDVDGVVVASSPTTTTGGGAAVAAISGGAGGGGGMSPLPQGFDSGLDEISGGNNGLPAVPPSIPVAIHNHLIVAGNNLYGSSLSAVESGMKNAQTNHTVLRLNDLGSISALMETALAVRRAGSANQPSIFSDSAWGNSTSIGLVGETSEGDGAALAHLAVGIHARTLRIGGLLRREHASTLNELVRISDHLKKAGTVSSSSTVFDSRLLVLPEVAIEVPKDDVIEKPTKKGRK